MEFWIVSPPARRWWRKCSFALELKQVTMLADGRIYVPSLTEECGCLLFMGVVSLGNLFQQYTESLDVHYLEQQGNSPSNPVKVTFQGKFVVHSRMPI